MLGCSKLAKASRQEAFIKAFTTSLNAGDAAMQAGYARGGAWNAASAFLKDPEVQKELKARLALSVQHQKLSPAYVLTSLREVVERCMQIKPVYLNGNIVKGKYTFKPAQAIKALELIGRNFDMFSTDVIVNLNVEIDKDLSSARNRIAKILKATDDIKDITAETEHLQLSEPQELEKDAQNSTTNDKYHQGLV